MQTLFSQLDGDWEVLSRRRDTADALAGACAVAGVASLEELVPAVRRAGPEAADVVLAYLARQACAGSDIAARALLQLLLPGTCRLAARWWALGSAEERAAAAVAAVYDRIRRYPIDRRPAKIAANVLLDANQDLARLARRVTLEAERTTLMDPGDVLSRVHDVHREATAAEEVCSVVADAVASGLVRREDAELILATRVQGEGLPGIARRRGAKLRTLQWRRQHAEAALVAAGAAA